MSFFIRQKSQSTGIIKADARKKGLRTRKNESSKLIGTEPISKKRRKTARVDEEIPSDSDIESEDEAPKKPIDSSDDEEKETAQEKRLRLAKQYLAQLEVEEKEKGDEEDFGTDAIAHRLKQDILEQTGKLHKEIAQDFIQPSSEDIRLLKGHQLPVTCVVISSDNKHIFSGSKDCSIIKWNVETGRKIHTIPGGRKGTEDKHVGHTAHVLCLAISTDSTYLASGDRNKLIHIWNPSTCALLHTFHGHRDAVSGLAFRKGTHQLFSASHDRSVKIWSVDERAYVETLFGHTDPITGIDSLTRERAVTSGGRDGSVRIWKIIEESQLVFHGHKGSIDCVSLINEEHFVSGGDDNSLAVWGVMKKKPLAVVHNAHGGDGANTISEGSKEHWITAVASLQHSDLLASGSKDGCIRFWQCGADFKSLCPLFSLPLVGFVNSLRFSSDGNLLVAGVGQEHRLGRWWRLKEAKNAVCIIKLTRKSPKNSS